VQHLNLNGSRSTEKVPFPLFVSPWFTLRFFSTHAAFFFRALSLPGQDVNLLDHFDRAAGLFRALASAFELGI